MNAPATLYSSRIEARVIEALTDTPVVLIAGPRQAGKTTLVRQMAGPERRYLTLDDELSLLAAKEDPVGMIRSLDRASLMKSSELHNFCLPSRKPLMRIGAPGVSC